MTMRLASQPRDAAESLQTERELAAMATELAGTKGLREVRPPEHEVVEALRDRVRVGADPLGEAFCRIRTARERREQGATYTPPAIVENMLAWSAEHKSPTRVVDPGAGSGRFILAAGQRFPEAALVAVETDPLAILLLRANAQVLGLSDRLKIEGTDYRDLSLPAVDGPTLFIGNPPYVRHHRIDAERKDWFVNAAARHGLRASKLAGLHIHFFLKSLELARPGDYGAYITAAEWLDVNYGSVLRHALADGLGGLALHLLSPTAEPFPDALTSAAITCWEAGHHASSVAVRSVERADRLDGLRSRRSVPWSTLRKAHRWSTIIRPCDRKRNGAIELGEICRVHRGQVTGANGVWIAGKYEGDLPPEVLFPAITRARELFSAGPVLAHADDLRRIVDLPRNLDSLNTSDRDLIDAFLRWAEEQGAHQSYVARHRKPWWRVGLRAPAPILCTYMARRPPAFVRNVCGARHINVAHGLYPRQELPHAQLAALTEWLNRHVGTDQGRTYAEGLTKFEPQGGRAAPDPEA
ncbi:MAG: methyltransferase [Acidobacteria bacterium]|nr:methyltransferase [Acidobacteriota bacterium]